MVIKREVLSRNKKGENKATTESVNTKTKTTGARTATAKVPLNSLIEILSDIYTLELKKDGKPRPIKMGREHELALKKLDTAELTEQKRIDAVIDNIVVLDPSYKHLLGLVVLATGAPVKVRRVLIDFAVLAISRNWVGRHKGSNNVFIELAAPVDITNNDVVAVICRNIKAYFEKQLEQRKKALKEEAEQATKTEDNFKISTADLKKRSANIVAIACLWALETGKCSTSKAITQMRQVMLPDDKPPTNVDTETCYSFASTIKSPINEFNTAIHYFEHGLEVSNERLRHAESAILLKDSELARNRNQQDELKGAIEDKDAEIKALKAELENLKAESHERKLSEQANRVHLRDDAGKAKSKAYNLLSEDIEPAMQLSLKALNRERPKVEVAIHQIELALESIEENLSWFK
jgi:hypothetical protein